MHSIAKDWKIQQNERAETEEHNNNKITIELHRFIISSLLLLLLLCSVGCPFELRRKGTGKNGVYIGSLLVSFGMPEQSAESSVPHVFFDDRTVLKIWRKKTIETFFICIE